MPAADAFLAIINGPAPAPGNVVVRDLLDDGRLRPKKRQRHEDTTHHRQNILVQLRRCKTLYSNTPQNRSWLKACVHETWPFTKRDSMAYARKRQYCYNLIFRNKNSSLVDDQEDRQSTECEQSQQRTYKDCLKDLPPGRGGPNKKSWAEGIRQKCSQESVATQTQPWGWALREMSRNWVRVISMVCLHNSTCQSTCR